MYEFHTLYYSFLTHLSSPHFKKSSSWVSSRYFHNETQDPWSSPLPFSHSTFEFQIFHSTLPSPLINRTVIREDYSRQQWKCTVFDRPHRAPQVQGEVESCMYFTYFRSDFFISLLRSKAQSKYIMILFWPLHTDLE